MQRYVVSSAVNVIQAGIHPRTNSLGRRNSAKAQTAPRNRKIQVSGTASGPPTRKIGIMTATKTIATSAVTAATADRGRKSSDSAAQIARIRGKNRSHLKIQRHN